MKKSFDIIEFLKTSPFVFIWIFAFLLVILLIILLMSPLSYVAHWIIDSFAYFWRLKK